MPWRSSNILRSEEFLTITEIFRQGDRIYNLSKIFMNYLRYCTKLRNTTLVFRLHNTL
jgi:hypothetical protein